MNNALLTTIRNINDSGRVALCGYFLAGYPSPQAFYACARAAKTIDVFEFGIPAGDPCFDGPVISSAHKAVSEQGMDAETALALIGGLRKLSQPRFVMTYAQEGRDLDGFLRMCVENDIQGVFAPDIHQHEAMQVAMIARALQLAYISFIDEHMPQDVVVAKAEISDVLYVRASQGHTGHCAALDAACMEKLAETIRIVRACKSEIIIAVGIGIQYPQQIRQLSCLDIEMVIVGTALMEQLGRGEKYLAEYVDALHLATFRDKAPAHGRRMVRHLSQGQATYRAQ